ncbi:hypothetical protein DH2020_026984 [Rehmannia glutinosa]|uniref:Uncharacterized protein n=1 Tax=Rehmannia glutinosa TaxID=99300 RepID=A0ABR0VZ84_REHGL
MGFLGVSRKCSPEPTIESDTIIGVIDTGVWPESESFNDKGFGPPPKKWEGACKGGKNFTCNNKVIGARYYNSKAPKVDSARDDDGHGSHCASIAAGNYVKGASFYGIAEGTARWGPSARIAAYKVCNSDGCNSADILAAFDDAIADGVDIITISVGGDYPVKLENDAVAIGSFIRKSVNAFSLNGTSFPLVKLFGEQFSEGKIVLCRLIDGVDEAFRAGALGSVSALESYIPDLPLSDVSYVVPVAASSLQTKDFPLVESYFRSTKSPKVDIMKSESVKNLDAPRVAGFSSKGPNNIIPDILKACTQLITPDITAPGIEILAAYSPEATPSDNNNDPRMVNYNILSEHQCRVHMLRCNCLSWIMDSRKDPLAEFAYGAGQIDPVKAVDPGLVYETFTEDYIKLLCSLGYDSTKLKQIFGVNTTCPAGPQTTPKDLNYPSMTRPEKSTYKVTTSTSPEYNITVTPNVLTFGATNEKKSFDVIISGKINNGKMVSASLEWSDGVHKVRSPIVVYPDNF